MSLLNILDWTSWAPGLENREQWCAWAEGTLSGEGGKGTPSLAHLPPIAKRRLSQLSKMVLEVGHTVLKDIEPVKLIFCSQYGEIVQQFKVTKNLIENDTVRPADFSLSVFNSAASLLSIHEKNKESISVQLSAEHCLINGLLSLIGYLNLNPQNKCMVIFADEALPEEYSDLSHEDSEAYAFAFLVSASDEPVDNSILLNYSMTNSESGGKTTDHPLDFLRFLLSSDTSSLRLNQGGAKLTLTKKGL